MNPAAHSAITLNRKISLYNDDTKACHGKRSFSNTRMQQRYNGYGGSGVNLGRGKLRRLESLASAHPSEQAGERLLELCVILSGSIIQTFILSK